MENALDGEGRNTRTLSVGWKYTQDKREEERPLIK